jgi:hypothetical protein
MFFQQYPLNNYSWYYVQEYIMIVFILSIISSFFINYCQYIFNSKLKILSNINVKYLAIFALIISGLFSAWKIINTKYIYEWEMASFEVSQWIKRNIPEDKVIASKDAGVLGYFLPHHVINIDGLVNNHEFFYYLKNRKINEYLKLKKVNYLVNLMNENEDDLAHMIFDPENIELFFIYHKRIQVKELSNRKYKIYKLNFYDQS